MSYRQRHILPKIKALRSRQQTAARVLLFCAIGFFILIVLGLAGVVLFMPYLQVGDVRVLGNEKVTTEDIQRIATSKIPRTLLAVGPLQLSTKSILFVNTDAIHASLIEAFPYIDNLVISKKYPSGLEITVRERKPVAVFCANSRQCFLMDSLGIIFEQLSAIPPTMAIISGVDIQDPALGQSLVNRRVVDTFLRLQKTLSDTAGVNITEVFVSNPLIFKTSEHWKIYLDPDQDENMQITKLDLLLKNEISSAVRKTLKYIYLQYKDRAYYQ